MKNHDNPQDIRYPYRDSNQIPTEYSLEYQTKLEKRKEVECYFKTPLPSRSTVHFITAKECSNETPFLFLFIGKRMNTSVELF